MEPPFRFAFVEEDVFRGSYPKKRNYTYLKRLHLTTVLSLTPDPPLTDLVQFCQENAIQSVHIRVDKPKETIPITYFKVAFILQYIIDPTHHPIYLHCLDGTLITGLVVACLRKLQLWSVSSCLSEYSRCFAEGMVGSEEAEFVERFQADMEMPVRLPNWLWGGTVIKKHPCLKLKMTSQQSTPLVLSVTPILQGTHSASSTQLPHLPTSHYSSSSASRRLSIETHPSHSDTSPRASVNEKIPSPSIKDPSKRRPVASVSSESSTPKMGPSTRQGSFVGLESRTVRPSLLHRPSEVIPSAKPSHHDKPSMFEDDEEEEEEEVAENNMSLMLKALALEFSHYRPGRT